MTRRAARKKAVPRKSSATSQVVVRVDGAAPPLATRIRRAARTTLTGEGRKSGRLEIAIVYDAKMRSLHKQWMGLNTPTDVLTFDLCDKPAANTIDGQLIVCRSVARRIAAQSGANWQSELILYVVHGCLHLCGYDDDTASNFAKMHRREDAILRELGYGPVFSSGERLTVVNKKASRARHR